MAARVAARYGSRRLFSSGSGKILSEEEKAAENAYFKKAEKEKMDKVARTFYHEILREDRSGHAGNDVARKILYELLVEGRSELAGTSADRVSTTKYRNYAVVAGTVTIIGALGWYLKGTAKKPEVQD